MHRATIWRVYLKNLPQRRIVVRVKLKPDKNDTAIVFYRSADYKVRELM